MMRRGHSLIVFPEGTRSTSGKVLGFRRGLFRLAIEAGLPVVPVAVIGSRHIMPKGRLMTCPGEVELVVHAALPTRGLDRGEAGVLAERARDVIAATVNGGARQAAGGAPGATGAERDE